MNYNVKVLDANGEEAVQRLSIPQILSTYGLDFHIEKSPLLAMNENGEQMLTPYYGLFNTASGECINTCKEGYQVSQNAEVVEMVMKGIEAYGDKLSVSKAGSLNGGRRVFMQLEIEGDSRVGDDIIKRYVTIIDSNDGSTGLSVGIGDLTMSCSNQFFKFYSKGDAKFRHTATLQQKIQTIPYLIQTALEESMAQIKVYNKFQSTQVSRDLANQMVKSILGYDKFITSVAEQSKLTSRSLSIMEDLYNNIEHEMDEKGNNLWGLHSGVTRWTTHSKPGPKRTNGHIESMLVGAGYKKNQDSLSFVSKYAGLELV